VIQLGYIPGHLDPIGDDTVRTRAPGLCRPARLTVVASAIGRGMTVPISRLRRSYVVRDEKSNAV
jgi:hypothetical protein